MRSKSIGWFVVFALAAGCAAAGSGEGAPGATPENTEWRLLDLASMPASGSAPTLLLDAAQQRASGNTGCNSFFGPYGCVVIRCASVRWPPRGGRAGTAGNRRIPPTSTP